MVSDGFASSEEGFLDHRQGASRKSFGKCDLDRWEKGVYVQFLFGVECVDEVALQAMSQ